MIAGEDHGTPFQEKPQEGRGGVYWNAAMTGPRGRSFSLPLDFKRREEARVGISAGVLVQKSSIMSEGFSFANKEVRSLPE